MMFKYSVGILIGAALGGLITYSLLQSAGSAGSDSVDLTVGSTAARAIGQSRDTASPVTSTARRADIAALERQSEDEPQIALAQAIELDAGTRRAAVRQIGAAWARRDPVAALKHTGTLPTELQVVFRDRVATEWAGRDAQSFLDYADGAADIDMLSAGLELLVPVEPERVFEISARLTPLTTPFFTTVGAKALRHMVEVNRPAALAFLESLPASARREQFMMEGAAAFAFEDPDAAFAWAAETNSMMALMGAMTSVSARNFEHAVNLATEYSDPRSPNRLDGMLVAGSLNDTRNMPEIMSGLIENADPRSLQLLASLTNAWIQKDTRAALDWLTQNDREINSATISSAAGALARADAAAAIRYLDDLPSEWRAEWIAQLAGPYAATNPEAAVNLIAELRNQGQDVHDAAFAGIIMTTSQNDPATAARLFETASNEVQSASFMNIAMSWANEDPRAAGDWATQLADPNSARTAVQIVSSRWLATDPEGAGNWALNLRRGTARDGALTQIIQTSSSHSLQLTDYLNAYSSEDARRESIGGIVDSLALRSTANAQTFVDSLPRLPVRSWAEQRLADLIDDER